MASDAATDVRQATREEMRDARLPLAYRDSCAHLLIPLNKCRRETWYAPWKCTVRLPSRKLQQMSGEGAGSSRSKRAKSLIHPCRGHQDERHSYEKCQYVEFKKRVAKMNELRESKEGARSN
ncbi:hypothetical protein M441DRAFT_47593 [Trichoderma asperellum CBS 433.97]|uniref:NADH dehydrogenase [ubiquinone] 1 beta subcomplex subunit 7 n=1 Tax=Trichoderma asperellum (strain ATCC 204424 / CBS 433.97 / NBRC 101777) TaxID=1042311 RepID=A0A2T3Z8K6_TRIA4|nr:hypothetical protein M441DRAFT_47593 [Trichoderma asperellum CBS 433.97]PTB41125.1 hypothetical protein M441DRAFT_47593 [Trichoderma asperellum CBS 433.97]